MPGSLATVGDLTSRRQMIGRVRRRSRAPPSLRDFVRWCSDISRRRSRAPPSLGDFVRCRSGISCRRPRAPPSLRDFVRCRPGISRRRSRAPPSFRDFVRCRSDISCRRSRAPPSFRDFVRCRSDISCRWPRVPPSLGDFVRCRSDISRRLRRGGANRKKKISVQVNLTLIFFFRFAERRRFELLIPFWSIHAFQACLLSHSSISPELPCNTDGAANIRIIC